MIELIPYFIKSAIGITMIFLVYWLFLRKEKYFQLTRAFLMLGLFYASIFPLIPLNFSLPENIGYYIFPDEIIVGASRNVKETGSTFSMSNLLLIVYFAGMVFFILRLLSGLFRIVDMIRRDGITVVNGRRIVFLSERIAPFSIFNMIFINKEDYRIHNAEKIIEHEEAHIRQFHSIDVFLIEIVAIIQWFNPIVWLYKRSLRETHEFLADEHLIRNGVNAVTYQQLLLTQVFGVSIHHLTNNFNQTILKRRFIMMTKSKSKKQGSLRLLAVAFASVAIVGLSLMSTAVISQQKNAAENSKFTKTNNSDVSVISMNEVSVGDTVFSVVKHIPVFPGGGKALFSYLGKNIKYPENAHKNNIEGKVYIEFIIEKDGSVSNAKVLRGFDKDCDAEALRVIQMMPDWEPGKDENNKPVRVSMSLPIKFLLGNGEDKEE